MISPSLLMSNTNAEQGKQSDVIEDPDTSKTGKKSSVVKAKTNVSTPTALPVPRRDGSGYWGQVRFEFDSQTSVFTGVYGNCDGPMTSKWKIYR